MPDPFLTLSDPMTAIVAHLIADPNDNLQPIVEGRIYGDTLPDGKTTPAITVQPVPGPDFHTISVNRQTLQIQCWGGTARGGGRIASLLALLVKDALNITLQDVDQTRVFWATVTGSAGLLHDPTTHQAYATIFVDVAVQSVTVA